MKTTSKLIDEELLIATLKKYGVIRASVFGSYVRDDFGPDSDIDLLVDYKEGVSLFDVVDLTEALETALGRKVDLVSRKYMPERLAKRIKDDLIPLPLD
jgi:predicted nucleotidyltransferase